MLGYLSKMVSIISHMREVVHVIEDYLYVAYFKQKWKEVTELLKSLGYDYSHIQLTRSLDAKVTKKNEE